MISIPQINKVHGMPPEMTTEKGK